MLTAHTPVSILPDWISVLFWYWETICSRHLLPRLGRSASGVRWGAGIYWAKQGCKYLPRWLVWVHAYDHLLTSACAPGQTSATFSLLLNVIGLFLPQMLSKKTWSLDLLQPLWHQERKDERRQLRTSTFLGFWIYQPETKLPPDILSSEITNPSIF